MSKYLSFLFSLLFFLPATLFGITGSGFRGKVWARVVEADNSAKKYSVEILLVEPDSVGCDAIAFPDTLRLPRMVYSQVYAFNYDCSTKPYKVSFEDVSVFPTFSTKENDNGELFYRTTNNATFLRACPCCESEIQDLLNGGDGTRCIYDGQNYDSKALLSKFGIEGHDLDYDRDMYGIWDFSSPIDMMFTTKQEFYMVKWTYSEPHYKLRGSSHLDSVEVLSHILPRYPYPLYEKGAENLPYAKKYINLYNGEELVIEYEGPCYTVTYLDSLGDTLTVSPIFNFSDVEDYQWKMREYENGEISEKPTSIKTYSLDMPYIENIVRVDTSAQLKDALNLWVNFGHYVDYNKPGHDTVSSETIPSGALKVRPYTGYYDDIPNPDYPFDSLCVTYNVVGVDVLAFSRNKGFKKVELPGSIRYVSEHTLDLLPDLETLVLHSCGIPEGLSVPSGTNIVAPPTCLDAYSSAFPDLVVKPNGAEAVRSERPLIHVEDRTIVGPNISAIYNSLGIDVTSQNGRLKNGVYCVSTPNARVKMVVW